jgi:hypothetical protein
VIVLRKNPQRRNSRRAAEDAGVRDEMIRAAGATRDVMSAEGAAVSAALFRDYWVVRTESGWTLVTAGGFHLPVSASDFGP